MIRIVPAFSKKDLQRMHEEMEREIDADILRELIEAGKEAVEIVRRKQGSNPYEDQTGNLNSSTGFLIQHRGKIVHTDFRKSAKGTDRATGVKVGREVAKREMLGDDGWGIILVAGMEYASWVQANHSRDVLASASNEIPQSLADALQSLSQEVYS